MTLLTTRRGKTVMTQLTIHYRTYFRPTMHREMRGETRFSTTRGKKCHASLWRQVYSWLINDEQIELLEIRISDMVQ